MEKMASGEEIGDLMDLDRPLAETVSLIAERKGTDVRDVMAVVLDRPRHEEGIRELREAGARVRLIMDGDVSAALMAASRDRPVDFLWGIGGTPEGVITAAAIKCIGGRLIGRLWPRDDDERRPRSTPATTSSACSPRTTCAAATTCFFSATGRHGRRRARGRPLRGLARGDDRVARDALALGHGAPRPARHDRTKLRELTDRY